MKKRIISVVLCLVLMLTAVMPALGAMSLSNFSAIRTYRGEFSDVLPDAWYYAPVRDAYERGLMDGKTSRTFDPSGYLTIAETVKLAAVLHKGYHTGSMDFPDGSPWYAPYFEYALEHDMAVGAYRNVNANAVRSDFANIIASALPDEAITPINKVVDGSIPDVWQNFSYGQAVYRLYRAGVLTGNDSVGSFYPGRTLRRAEAAAIVSRIADADTRVSFSLIAPLTAEQIYKLASPAVFFIEALNEEDIVVKTGSGFFISESGLAATNYHVLVGASSVRLTLVDGETVNVSGIYDFNRKHDTALIQAQGDGFPYLEIADSSQLQTGATVFALGSPLGLQASFSRGIVSQSLRRIDELDSDFIQLDAAISSGSSGGALLDVAGRAVGVTAATAVGGQNINLAVPMNLYTELSSEEHVTFASLLTTITFYQDSRHVPDFGSIFDVELHSTGIVARGTSYSYRVSDFPRDADSIIDEYAHILEQNSFELTNTTDSNGYTAWTYFRSGLYIYVTFGIEIISGIECFTITID